MTRPPPCQAVTVSQVAPSAASRGLNVTVALTVRSGALVTSVSATEARTPVCDSVNSGKASIAKIASADVSAIGRRLRVPS